MDKWLIIYRNGEQRVIEAEDFYELHTKEDSRLVAVVVHLDNVITTEE